MTQTILNNNYMNNNTNNAPIEFSMSEMESDAIAFQEIPLTALSKRSLQQLSLLLNPKKILRSEEGYERDWRGLATLSKQNCVCDENLNGGDPTTKVIQLWCTNNPKTATFAYLEQYLGIIDRWDVSDDIYENLVEDTKTYQKKLHARQNLNSDETIDGSANNNNGDFGHGSDPNILTTSDVIRAQKGLPLQMYDAFVLYADADVNYVSEILTKLEDNPEYNFKICIKDRDLLGGVQFEHVALTQLIEERCKHLIVILTGEFLKSPENKFLVNYTQALQIQHKTRKIVPLLYEEGVDIPRTLKIYTHLRYYPGTASLFDFWSKLASSIQNVNGSADLTTLSTSNCRKDITRSPTLDRQTSTLSLHQVNALPSPPSKIPTISIVPPDDSDTLIKKDRVKPSKSLTIRSATSAERLHTPYGTRNSTSLSDLSTASICSNTKKKRKWSSKILHKVFSRGSS